MAADQSPVIVLAGPPAAAPFLERVRGAIACRGRSITLLIGPNPLEGFGNWGAVRVLVPFGLPFSAAAMDLAPRLEAIIVPSLGYEGIDLAAATARGVIVANGAAQENFESVAEAAVMLILMCLYDIHRTEQRLRDNMPRQGPPNARMLRGKTVGIIGFGNIAKALVARLVGFQVRIVVHTRSPLPTSQIEVEQVGLDELLVQSDVILPLVPLTAETRHILSRDALSLVKPGAVLVNLSRGDVIDEEALLDPTIGGRLGGLALDVFALEPLPTGSRLRDWPNAILTQHEISHTAENLDALFRLAVKNIEAALRGQPPLTPLNAL